MHAAAFTIRVCLQGGRRSRGHFAKRPDSELFVHPKSAVSSQTEETGKGRQIYAEKHMNSVGNSSGDTDTEL